MNLADAIFARLSRETGTIFYLPGGGAAFLVDALGRSGLRAVCNLHEAGAGFAALAYAQIRGFGVCLVTSGPGATNAVTPCAAAWTDSAPVLFISGQANSATTVGSSGLRTRGVQEVDIVPVVASVTKRAAQPSSAPEVLEELERMIALCKSGREGGCWLSVPLDIQAVEVNHE